MTTVSERAAQLHRDAIVVDAHNDIPMSLLLRDLYPERSSFRDRWIPELRAGGVDVQVLPIYNGSASADGALRESLLQLTRIVEEAGRNPDDVAICRDGSEILATTRTGRIALVLALEGCPQFTNDAGLVRVFHALGIRIISFTHMGRTALADGSAEEDAGSRLTRLGIEVLGEMQRLGIVMDVSHLSATGTEHALELTTRPLIASHSGARAVHDHHRNLPDSQVRAIAATGGVVGLNLLPAILGNGDLGQRGVLRHLEHLVEVAGIDHVGIGPDFVRDILDQFYAPDADLKIEGLDPRQVFDGLAGSADLPLLTQWVLDFGLSEADAKKVLGANFMRVFDAVLGRPA